MKKIFFITTFIFVFGFALLPNFTFAQGMMAGFSNSSADWEEVVEHTAREGQEKIHIVMGMRISGCDTSTAFPAISNSWMPMMNMMWGGWSSPFNKNNSTNNMMNFGFIPFVSFGWIFMILWWFLIIVGIIALIKWFTNQLRVYNQEKTALEILQERYAKGEINKKEFEEKKKDLS